MFPHASVSESIAAFITLATNGSTESADPATWLIYNGGALGVIMLLVVTGQLRTKAEVNQLNARIVSLEAQLGQKDELIKAFQTQLTGQTLPALARSAQVIEHLPHNEAAVRDELRLTRDRVSELASQLSSLLGKDSG